MTDKKNCIAVFGGTAEGRLIAEVFRNTDINIHICTATEYGGTLLPDCKNVFVHTGRMNEEEISVFLQNISPDYCFDATHPYAVLVSENIYRACESIGLKYIRILREEGEIGEGIIYKDSIDEAVAFLNTVEGNIFITTGSRDLEKYTLINDYKNRCVARVLPTYDVIKKCADLGFEGKNLVAMQGPFGKELNINLFRNTNTRWVVTKNSGKTGGFEEKISAAKYLNAGIVVIGRPTEVSKEPMTFESAVDFIKKEYAIEQKRSVYLIGLGVGSSMLVTKQATECLEICDLIIGAKRICDIYEGEKPVYTSYVKEDILNYIEEHTEYKRIGVVYSGDIGFYSGAKGMNSLLEKYDVHNISGISSVVYFLNKIGKGWDDVKFVSLHGKKVNIVTYIKNNEKVCAILGSENDVADICKQLVDFDMTDVSVTVGERLSYDDEKITSGSASDFVDGENNKLSVVLFENPTPKTINWYGIKDDEFIRGDVPMTKEEIRVVALSKLKLKKNSVLYDIGAGTGSVSIEAALQCEDGFVYAVERKANAIRLIKKNRKKFKTENLKVVEGEAPYCFDDLPKPTHAFIGGSNGRLLEIVRAVRARNKNVRFVINAVTIETLSVLEEVKKEFPQYDDMEIIQLNVSRSKELGRYHLMSAENPVYVISFGGKR